MIFSPATKTGSFFLFTPVFYQSFLSVTIEIMSDAIAILKDCGALLEGHFLLSSGRHSDTYFQCARLLQYPEKAAAVLAPLAEQIKGAVRSGRIKVDAVAGPALGGIIPAYELGRLLGVPAFFTERDEHGSMSLRRGFEVTPAMSVSMDVCVIV